MRKFLFEPVYYNQPSFFWDYRVRIERDFKGYYHWHQCCEFLLVHEGQGRVVVNQQSFEIKRGMFFFFQPYQLHQVYAYVAPELPYVRSIFYSDPHLIDKELRQFPRRQARFDEMQRNLELTHAHELTGMKLAAMEKIFGEYEEARVEGRGEEEEELSALFLQVLSWLPSSDSLCTGRENRPQPNRPLRYSEIVMNWIERNFQGEPTMEKMAEETHLSPNYLSRVFRQETGSSITDYLTARRIRQACRLLETTELSVERIGNEVGFVSSSYFIQLFKREVGETPLRYRHSKK